MKRCLTLVIVIGLFSAVPAPAVAGFFDRDDDEGVRFQDRIIVRIMAARRGIDPEDTYPGIFRQGYGGTYYDSNWPSTYPAASYYAYPTATYYPEEPPVDVNAVTFRMHVPDGALVWFEDEATSQTGDVREFVSPSLTPGRDYVYHIRVKWDENGKVVERKRNVSVHAGDRINLKFGR